MKNWLLGTTESRSIKNQLPTAYLVLVGSWWDVRANLKRRILNFSLFSFVQNQTIYSDSGKFKKFRQQHSGDQKNRNAKITSKVPLDATQREDLLWNSFKEDSEPLGDSYHQAKRRLRSLIFPLEKQPDVYNRNSLFIQEFIQLGHMEEVPRNKIHMPATNCFYLPHHCVIEDASSTTKLRVVFDASAKSASGVSLNDRLLVGPHLQKDLFGILICFCFK